MLTHGANNLPSSNKIVVLGANGFVGGAIAENLTKSLFDQKNLTRKEVDLSKGEALEKLLEHIDEQSSLVVACAKAPCKSHTMLVENVTMLEPICKAIKIAKPFQVLYVSSDAVYSDSSELLSESSVLGATNPHGIMHAAREVMLADATANVCPLAIIRPTLIYGLNDPHNGYGPNKFRRLAEKGLPIQLLVMVRN